jgi:DNA-binding GntR family transcriptional regulator
MTLESAADDTSRGRRPPAEQPQRRNATARVVESLRRKLAENTWSAGDRLPSEPTLAAELGVSRVTIRAALSRLESEGLVNRRHGSGTYVNSIRPLVRSLHMNTGTAQLIGSAGRVPGTTSMSLRQFGADEEIAERLSLEPGAPVMELYRVRTSDDVPVAVTYDYFSAALLPEQPVSLGPSLYSFLSTVCGVDVTFGIAMIEPEVAGEEIGGVLGVDPGALCMVIKQVDYDVSERPVSYSLERLLASAFTFQLVRQGPSVPGHPGDGHQLDA